jgi:hypothetical protein
VFSLYDVAVKYGSEAFGADWDNIGKQDLTGSKAPYRKELMRVKFTVSRDRKHFTMKSHGQKTVYAREDEPSVFWNSRDGLVSVDFTYGE